MPYTKLSPLERFLAKIHYDQNGCWLWQAHCDRKGYGRFTYGVPKPAHRAAWELLRGPIPEGLTIDHLCRVKNCVNPAHLEPVTSRENTHRSDNPAMQNARRGTCLRGHAWTPENTIWQGPKKQWRWCRSCGLDRLHAYRDRKRRQKKITSAQ